MDPEDGSRGMGTEIRVRRWEPDGGSPARKGLQMTWDFTTDPEFAEKLEWMDSFVRDEVEPLDLVWGDKTFHPLDDKLRKVVDPLKQRVREEGLWACHLGPELGGSGYGQVKLS